MEIIRVRGFGYLEEENVRLVIFVWLFIEILLKVFDLIFRFINVKYYF